jgi:hypothetical protein
MKKVSPARLPQQAFDGLKSTALRKKFHVRMRMNSRHGHRFRSALMHSRL